MKRTMLSVEEASKAISQGGRYWLAGEEALLRQLPKGHWIGGSIPYFMEATGGVFSRRAIFATELPEIAGKATTRLYGPAELPHMTDQAFEYGINFIIIPFGSEAHFKFAKEAPSYEEILMKPFVGWIAGVAVEDIGKVSAKVFDGETGSVSEDKAVVMHVELPSDKPPKINIINLFKQGAGDEITFDKPGLMVEKCRINGKLTGFADYLLEKKIDTKLPLVADYHGAMINTSFQSVDRAKGVVLYAPVFEGIRYKIAAPIGGYAEEFRRAVPAGGSEPFFSCNCILNYLYGELEGKITEGYRGPFTFGEIAFQLLNQTLVYVELT